MKTTLYISSVLFLIVSCQPQSTETVSEEKVTPTINVVQSAETKKTVASLEIEGMGCAMACGSAINKALSDLDGVVATEIDFDADRDSDFAIVEFDESKVSADQMMEAVNTLRKGHYKVSAVTIEQHVPAANGASAVEDPKTGAEATKTKGQIDTRSFTLPNILDILNRFIR